MNTKKVPVSNSESQEIQLKKDIEYQGVTNKVRFPYGLRSRFTNVERLFSFTDLVQCSYTY
jgi:hypothetical protein